jgi:predicted phage terminase large subunit-like protein
VPRPRGRAAFPNTRISPEKDSEHELVTTRRGSRMATSLDGIVTGRGCDILIIDDPQKAHDAMSKAERERVIEMFDTTLSTRLNDKNTGVIIVVAQRLHVDDLVGHLLETGDWVHLCVPAIAQQQQQYRLSDRHSFVRPLDDVLHPERESFERLMEAKRQLGTMQFSAQYLQSPVPESGNLIRWEWFKTYRAAPTKDAGDKIVISIDTASKADEINDYSVATVWLVKVGYRTGRAYLTDLYRERLLFPDLTRKVEAIVVRHRPDALVIEGKGSGTSLIQVFKDHRFVRPIAFKPQDDKVTRMSHQAVKIESGRVFIPEHASWLNEFKAELLAFPKGKYDDQVDSVAQFLAWLDQHIEYFVGMVRLKGMR